MDDDATLLFDLPSVGRRKVTGAFDGGRITSDGGVALLALANRRIGIVDRIAALIADPSDPALVASMLRASAAIRRSSSPVAGCPTAAATCAPSPASRAGRTRRI